MIVTFVGVVVVLAAFVDVFESMVLPRRVTRRWRPARIFYRSTWRVWRRLSLLLPAGRYRENALSVFGPLSLLSLFGCWAATLITGFALINSGRQSLPPETSETIWDYLYHSGETFFTLGYGDLTPVTHLGRMLAVVEAGIGFGFMAVVIGYLPVLYQAFSRREQSIALLDARAGSPPTAAELLRRAENAPACAEVEPYLVEWEVWSAELLESHLSFPVLGFYRSQHDNQSWLAALAVILDTAAIVIVSGDAKSRRRAELTFAMARHACVDLCLVFRLPPVEPPINRLTPPELDALMSRGATLGDTWERQAARLTELRELYEPFLYGLSNYFCLYLPRFFPERTTPDNWQTSAWTKRAPGITELPASAATHFGG